MLMVRLRLVIIFLNRCYVSVLINRWKKKTKTSWILFKLGRGIIEYEDACSV